MNTLKNAALDEDLVVLEDSAPTPPDDRVGRYTAPQVAEKLGIDSSTVRKCRMPFLLQAFPESRIKGKNGKFTALALWLFENYQDQVILERTLEPEDWVEAVQDRFPAVVEAVVVEEPEFQPQPRQRFNHAAHTLEHYALALTNTSDNLDTRLAQAQVEGANTLDRIQAIAAQLRTAEGDRQDQTLELQLKNAYNQELTRQLALEAARVQARQDFQAAKPEAQD